jgi:hypothetical protein
MASETYEFLQELLKTGDADRWNYPKYIRNVFDAKNNSSIKIVIAFENDDDFLESIGVDEDDDKYVWRRFAHNYEYDSYDSDRYTDDWTEGYVLDGLSDENLEKVDHILKIIEPELTVNRGDDVVKSEIAKAFANKFPTEVDEITYEYGYENQHCIARAVREQLLKETKNPFLRFGIVEKDWGWRFETTVSILLNWYRTLKAEDEDIKGLLKKLIERYQPNANRGDWYEMEHSVWCDDYDKDAFNYEAGRILDTLIEAIDESMSENENYEDYLKMLDVVSNLGGFNRWVDIPKEDRRIRFLSIDPKTNLLTFQITKKGGDYGKTERRSVKTFEDLHTTLNHPELFEHLKKTIEKIL